jgi:hypothetical protein
MSRLSFRKEHLIISLNSTAIFLVTYYLLWFFVKLVTALSALAFDISSVIKYDKIEFLIRGSDWSHDAVQVVFATGPLFALVVTILLLILYGKVIEETGLLRLAVVWLFTHGYVFFFGDMLMGAVFNKGLGYVLMYMFYMDTGKMLLTLSAFIFLILYGLLMCKFYLFTANSYYNFLVLQNRAPFMLFQFIVPFLAGNLIIMLSKLPHLFFYEAFVNASMIIVLLPVFLRGLTMQDLWFDEDSRRIRISWPYLIILAGILIFFRTVLEYGIRI